MRWRQFISFLSKWPVGDRYNARRRLFNVSGFVACRRRRQRHLSAALFKRAQSMQPDERSLNCSSTSTTTCRVIPAFRMLDAHPFECCVIVYSVLARCSFVCVATCVFFIAYLIAFSFLDWCAFNSTCDELNQM